MRWQRLDTVSGAPICTTTTNRADVDTHFQRRRADRTNRPVTAFQFRHRGLPFSLA